MYIDSHCHLTHERLQEQGGPAQAVQNAGKAGVGGMLTICCRVEDEFPEVLAAAKAFDNVWCTVGTHPHDAGAEEERAITKDRLVELATSDPKIVGIGETGLDYHYEYATVENQQENFRKHIRACLETGLPLIVHSREAEEDTMRILREEGAGGNLSGVIHCFSSGRELGEAALDFGFYISFSGIVTFKKAQALQDFSKDVPLDRVLVETDAPYLAPEPYRGKVNEPALVVHTGQFLAELRGVSEAVLARQTKDNFFNLFSKAQMA